MFGTPVYTGSQEFAPPSSKRVRLDSSVDLKVKKQLDGLCCACDKPYEFHCFLCEGEVKEDGINFRFCRDCKVNLHDKLDNIDAFHSIYDREYAELYEIDFGDIVERVKEVTDSSPDVEIEPVLKDQLPEVSTKGASPDGAAGGSSGMSSGLLDDVDGSAFVSGEKSGRPVPTLTEPVVCIAEEDNAAAEFHDFKPPFPPKYYM